MKLIFISLALASSGYLALCVIRAFSEVVKLPNESVSASEPFKKTAQVKPKSNYWKRDFEQWGDKHMNDNHDM
jgi:hypothetical protein